MAQESLALLDLDAKQAAWDATIETNKTKLEEYIKTLKMTIFTQGTTGAPSRIHIQLQDASGDDIDVAEVFFLRVRVTDDTTYPNATNATIAAFGGTTVVETFTALKDLVFQSDASGLVEIDATDAVAETFRIRPGHPPIQAHFLNVNNSLPVTHAP